MQGIPLALKVLVCLAIPTPPKNKKRQEQLSTFWPPKKLPPLPTVWTAVDAFDPARQGRTLETLLDMILLWLFVGFGGMV